MRYKFDLKPRIKLYTEWVLEHYNENRAELNEQKKAMMPTLVPAYSGMPSSHDVSRQTEQIAIKMSTSAYIQNLELCVNAVERMLSHCDETDIRLIQLVYWRRSHNVVGAGMSVGLSKTAAYKRINALLTALAAEIGLVDI